MDAACTPLRAELPQPAPDGGPAPAAGDDPGVLRKLLLSVAAVAAAAGIAGLGTFADFSASTAPTQQVSTGTLTLELGAPGPTNRFAVAATNIAPGDTIQRAASLTYGGSISMSAVTLTTAPTVSSVLDTDTTHGLRMALDRCSVPWTEAGTAPAYTYSCSGTTQTVLAQRAIIGSNLSLSNLTLTAGTTDHLRLTVTLPSTADNTFQGRSSTIQYTFTGGQRPGTNQ